MNDLQIQIEEKGKITTNLETLKKDLEEVAKRYKGLVVSEDSIQAAKNDLAALRKLKDGIETKRKEIKRAWSEPYTAFESEVKEALKIIEEPIYEIDKQVKEFAERDRKAKEEAVKKLYEENVPEEYREFVPYEKVFNDKWLNKSTKDSDIKADLSTAVTQVRADLTAINALQSECEEDCIKAYKEAGNSLAAAIQRNQVHLYAKQAAEKQLREEAERKAKEEAERKAAEAAAEEAKAEEVIANEEIIDDLPFSDDDFASDDLPFAVDDPVVQIDLYSMDDVEKVTKFLDSNKIRYSYGTVTKI